MAKRSMLTMTEREYRANLAGLNIFFGAVLGFVLAGTETLDAWRFALVLTMVAGTVVSILYITASEKRFSYAAYTAVVIATLPFIVETIMGKGYVFPPKVQPTLAVWAAMTILIEFAPRDRSASPPLAED